MVNYPLSHLTQDDSQTVSGPIQDDEALFLFSIVRGMRLQRILEIGGLSGYSAKNFIAATTDTRAKVYTVDINEVPQQHPTKHICIIKPAETLVASDFNNEPLDLVFFDCHDYNVQMNMFHRLYSFGIIDSKTVLALHDTNTHPFKSVEWGYQDKEGGYIHQPVERHMVNSFKEMGYDIFNLHTKLSAHNSTFPYRHGVSIATKFTTLSL